MREAIYTPEFPRRGFLRRICRYLMVQQGDVRQEPEFVAAIIFESAGSLILEVEPELREMLVTPRTISRVYRVLEKLGREAVEMAPYLIELIERGAESDGIVATFAAVAIDDPNSADRIRIWFDDEGRRAFVCDVLVRMGPRLAGRVDEFIDLLYPLVKLPNSDSSCIRALGSVGRHDRAAVERLMDLARARPARMVQQDTGVETFAFDAVPYERAAAIDGLRWAIDFADEVVPFLIQALDSFQEPESSNRANWARVCRALEGFGMLAGPAVPRLKEILEARVKSRHLCFHDFEVFDLIRAIGPEAAAPLRDLVVIDGDEGVDPRDEELEPCLEILRPAWWRSN